MEPPGFPIGLDEGYERKEGVKRTTKLAENSVRLEVLEGCSCNLLRLGWRRDQEINL